MFFDNFFFSYNLIENIIFFIIYILQTIVLIFVAMFITMFQLLYTLGFFRWLECRTWPFISHTRVDCSSSTDVSYQLSPINFPSESSPLPSLGIELALFGYVTGSNQCLYPLYHVSLKFIIPHLRNINRYHFLVNYNSVLDFDIPFLQLG